jgi:hypothetical protein
LRLFESEKPFIVVAGLDPAIHDLLAAVLKDVDARAKPGHGGSVGGGEKWSATTTGIALDSLPLLIRLRGSAILRNFAEKPSLVALCQT